MFCKSYKINKQAISNIKKFFKKLKFLESVKNIFRFLNMGSNGK